MFTFYYNQNGARRKQFVKAISGILEVRPRYTGIPKCAYEMGFVTVTREGNIEISDTANREEVEELIEKLGMMGYDHEPVEGVQPEGESTADEQPAEDEQPTERDMQPAEEELPAETEQTDEDEQPAGTMPTANQISEDVPAEARPCDDEPADDQPTDPQPIEEAGEAETESDDEIAMTISVPRSIMSELGLENLKKLVHAKEDLLKQAFDIASTEIEVTDEAISFPWFNQLSPDELKYASQFISGLCRFTNNSKRITSKRRREDNPKFTMRVWAIRMGFSGEEHKALRKYLMHRLPGDAAFRYGRPDDSTASDSGALPDAQ